MVAHTLSTAIKYNGAITRPQFGFFYEGMGPLEYKRTQLALKALTWGADYLLLVDWDMVFPPDAFLKLAAHDKPFVAVNYMQRHGERRPSAIAAQDVFVTGSGLQAVAAVGLGLALIKAHVLKKTPRPWFLSHYDDAGNCTIGEDVHFCNQVRAAGGSVFVDHDLAVGHIAETVLTLQREDSDDQSCRQPATGHI